MDCKLLISNVFRPPIFTHFACQVGNGQSSVWKANREILETREKSRPVRIFRLFRGSKEILKRGKWQGNDRQGNGEGGRRWGGTRVGERRRAKGAAGPDHFAPETSELPHAIHQRGNGWKRPLFSQALWQSILRDSEDRPLLLLDLGLEARRIGRKRSTISGLQLGSFMVISAVC